MKAINDTIVNLGTGVLLIIASSLICAPHPDNFHLEVPDELRVIFLSVTALIALTNLMGKPKQVEEHWEAFGDSFFPFTAMSIREKRRLAGMLETLGIGLTLMGYPTIRGFGYALLMIMYGRGAMANARISLPNVILAGGISLMSGLLLKDEFYTVL